MISRRGLFGLLAGLPFLKALLPKKVDGYLPYGISPLDPRALIQGGEVSVDRFAYTVNEDGQWPTDYTIGHIEDLTEQSAPGGLKLSDMKIKPVYVQHSNRSSP